MCLHTSKFVCFPAFEKNPLIFNYILLPEDDSIGETWGYFFSDAANSRFRVSIIDLLKFFWKHWETDPSS